MMQIKRLFTRSLTLLMMIYSCVAPLSFGSNFDQLTHDRPPSFYILSDQLKNMTQEEKSAVMVVLSVDGGGTYGLIPLKVLKTLEEKTQHRTANLFDVLTGVSTGAIISVGLSGFTNNSDFTPNASDVIEDYNDSMKSIFDTSWHQKIKSGLGVIQSEFTSKSRKQAFEKRLDPTLTMAELSSKVIIYAYSLNKRKIVEFSSITAKKNPKKDYFVIETLMAATAAPFFFPIYEISNTQNTTNQYMIDGGIVMNNPSFHTIRHLMTDYPNKQFILVSLGTGVQLQNASETIINNHLSDHHNIDNIWSAGIIMHEAQSNLAITSLLSMIKEPNSRLIGFFRFNEAMPIKSPSAFNAKEKDILTIQKYAKTLIKNNQEQMDALVNLLLDIKSINTPTNHRISEPKNEKISH